MFANEVAEYTGLSKDFVYLLVKQSRIPHIKIGRKILFKKDSIDEWINEIQIPVFRRSQ